MVTSSPSFLGLWWIRLLFCWSLSQVFFTDGDVGDTLDFGTSAHIFCFLLPGSSSMSLFILANVDACVSFTRHMFCCSN